MATDQQRQFADASRRFVMTLLGGLLVGVVGYADYLTGLEASFTIFYLAPIAFVTWHAGKMPGVLMALLSSVVWFAVDRFGLARYSSTLIPYWNGLVNLGSFLLVAFLFSALKSAHQDLQRKVAERTASLQKEITERKHSQEQLRVANEELTQNRNDLMSALSDAEKSHEELKTAQWQLIEAAKLESIGRLAAGVAHEVKNPLAVIQSGVDYLATHVAADDVNVGGVLTRMENGVERADTVISELLSLSAPRELDLSREDINRLIEQAITLVKHDLDRTPVKLAMELREDLPMLWLDGNRIKQALINVLTNALHAMPNGGTLAIRTRVCAFDATDLCREPARFSADSRVAVIEVDDTGAGIPEDKLDKIFEPFFTTKPSDQGTGLGLTVTKKIVELHGGLIDIRNRPEGGVKVQMLLPAG